MSFPRTSSAQALFLSARSIRLRDPQADPRRLQGVLTAADDHDATLLLDDGAERTVPLDDVDKARTVFEWGPKPKPGIVEPKIAKVGIRAAWARCRGALSLTMARRQSRRAW